MRQINARWLRRAASEGRRLLVRRVVSWTVVVLLAASCAYCATRCTGDLRHSDEVA